MGILRPYDAELSGLHREICLRRAGIDGEVRFVVEGRVALTEMFKGRPPYPLAASEGKMNVDVTAVYFQFLLLGGNELGVVDIDEETLSVEGDTACRYFGEVVGKHIFEELLKKGMERVVALGVGKGVENHNYWGINPGGEAPGTVAVGETGGETPGTVTTEKR